MPLSQAQQNKLIYGDRKGFPKFKNPQWFLSNCYWAVKGFPKPHCIHPGKTSPDTLSWWRGVARGGSGACPGLLCHLHWKSLCPVYLLEPTSVSYRIQVVHHEAQWVQGSFSGEEESEERRHWLLGLHLLVHVCDLVEHQELHGFIELVLQKSIWEEAVA